MQSQAEEQEAIYHSFQKLMHAPAASIKVAYLARIVKYDKKKHIADIQPLAEDSGGEKSAQFLDVPISQNCYILQELLDALKGSFEATDNNSHLPEHQASQFMQKVNKVLAKPYLRPGVTVVAVVLDRDADNFVGTNAEGAEAYALNSSRMHDANDSIIVGVV